jgi:hypothetical protein
MELRARGWPIATAGREVGVSRTTAANWARGDKAYRGGQVVGFVDPLDWLKIRTISARYLSQYERVLVADLRRHDLTVRAIAAELGRAPSTYEQDDGARLETGDALPVVGAGSSSDLQSALPMTRAFAAANSASLNTPMSRRRASSASSRAIPSGAVPALGATGKA